MMRAICVWSSVLVLAAGASARDITLIDEDFETGVEDWTLVRLVDNTLWTFPPPAYDDQPMLFPADATGIFGPNAPYIGPPAYVYTKCAGFAGDLPAPQYDGTTAEWLRLQVPNAVPAGSKVILNLELDRYVYTSSGNGTYQYCNRFFILTDSVYDNPLFGPVGGDDGVDPITLNGGNGNGSGARSSVWNHETGTGDNLGGLWKHTSWTDATNKVFTSLNGNIEIRLEQYGRAGTGTYGQLTNAWDNLHVVLKDFTTQQVLWELNETFESYNSTADLEAVWTRVLRPDEDPSRPDNDTPTAFGPADPLLYDNANNPGSQSVGFTSPVLTYADPTRVQWLQKQLTGVVPAGTTARLRLEYDWYVFLPFACPTNNDAPMAFDAAGTGINGPNTGHNGTASAGYSSDLGCYDGSPIEWIQRQYPAAIPAGTYDATVDAKVYVYKNATGNDLVRSRIYMLTQDLYNNPSYDPNTDPYSSKKGLRKSTGNQTSAGAWISVTDTTTFKGIVSDGNVEIRLLQQETSTVGAQTVAWDNLTITLTNTTTLEVFTFTEDFESGMGAWTAMSYPNDPPDPTDAYGVGNRVYLLTDDEYNKPSLDMNTNQAGFYDPGYRADLWPSSPGLTFAANGVWQHFVDERDITTTTGDFEIRLLCHDKYTKPLVQTVAWDNVKLSLIVPCNAPRFDVDADGDVDHADFSLMQACFSGDGVTWTGECRCFNADGDADIDTIDVQAFEACASGPGVKADENCDSALPPP